jgi:hypothetical protein
MARSMSKGRKVSRPAQGDNKEMREDAKWAPKPAPAAKVVSSGSQSKPKSAGAQARFKPDYIKVTKVIKNPGPAA